ncbi:MAG: M43 family zinc metalloprotease [Cytophagales bacterium]|nr:M43 family zinc metalloprotease [Cytophagales bacterium]
MMSSTNSGNTVMRLENNRRYFAVRFHIIRRTNGTGGFDPNLIPQILHFMNAAYNQTNVEFYNCPDIDFINNDQIFTYERARDENILRQRLDDNAINIYYGLVNPLTEGYCGYAFYPWLNNSNFIFINADPGCSHNQSVVVHELGHFFGIVHTHDGGNELVNGTNCATAGDRYCDTPADPNMFRNDNYHVDAACNYIGAFRDSNNQSYSPDTRNFMSYSTVECRNRFSGQQLNAIWNWANSAARYDLSLVHELTNQNINATTLTLNTRNIADINNVRIINGGSLIIDVCGSTDIENFECEIGSQLDIK